MINKEKVIIIKNKNMDFLIPITYDIYFHLELFDKGNKIMTQKKRDKTNPNHTQLFWLLE